MGAFGGGPGGDCHNDHGGSDPGSQVIPGLQQVNSEWRLKILSPGAPGGVKKPVFFIILIGFWVPGLPESDSPKKMVQIRTLDGP